MCVFNVVNNVVMSESGVVVCKYINEDITYARLCHAYPGTDVVLFV